jgi:hypothetical protein
MGRGSQDDRARERPLELADRAVELGPHDLAQRVAALRSIEGDDGDVTVAIEADLTPGALLSGEGMGRS